VTANPSQPDERRTHFWVLPRYEKCLRKLAGIPIKRLSPRGYAAARRSWSAEAPEDLDKQFMKKMSCQFTSYSSGRPSSRTGRLQRVCECNSDRVITVFTVALTTFSLRPTLLNLLFLREVPSR